jgi:hypothetical protein
MTDVTPTVAGAYPSLCETIAYQLNKQGMYVLATLYTNASLDLAATLDQDHCGHVSTTRTDSTAQLLPCQNVHDNRDRADG